MSIIRRSDVKNHLSTRASETVHLFTPANQPGTTGDSGSELPSTKPSVPDSGDALETATIPEKL